MAAAVRVTQGFCDRAVLLCTETDYQMKTSYDDPERLLGLLLLRLSEEAKHALIKCDRFIEINPDCFLNIRITF